MHCAHCGRETPEGHYCGYCGADLTAQTAHDPRRRRHTFAADPHEHVYHPAIVSTFFPHLGSSRAQQVRWVLLAGVAAIFLLGLGRYVPVAIVAAALLVPVLYLFYFYEVQIYGNEPLRVLAGTFVAGIVLGGAMSLLTYRLVLSLSFTGLLGPTAKAVWVLGVALPLLAQVLMLAGPLFLYLTRRNFDEVLDGLGFGVASGLGFAAAQSVVNSWLLITGPFQQIGAAYSWALPTVRVSLLAPLVDAATTGLICAALWLRRDPTPPTRSLGALASLPVAVGLAILGQVVPAVGSLVRGGLVENLLWYGGALVVLLLLVRHVVHVGLVEKARALGHGATIRCPHCFHTVPDLPFCPHCGLAMRSTARRARQPIAGEGAQS